MARVLIVDDSLVARKLLAHIITAMGHSVVGEAKDGSGAVSQYRKLLPDIVTMDLALKDSDGSTAISDILREFPMARIVVVSARQERAVIVDALERGARHFIAKPFSAEKIAAVLQNVLEQNFSLEKQKALVNSLKAGLDGQPVSPARILIVDDSAVARQGLRKIITDLGHEVAGEAENGSQAFVAYTELKPDIVTMDLTMQGLGGLEATAKIIAADSKAKIIVISAMESKQAIIEALERGARHFIVKPIKRDKVALVINNVLRQKFDPAEHQERVRRLKAMNVLSEGGLMARSALPPYQIIPESNRLVHVMITESITHTSLAALSEELEEFLGDTVRVLLDFGTMPYLEEDLAPEFSLLIQKVENNNGIIKAITNSEQFLRRITELDTDQYNFLANILRVY